MASLREDIAGSIVREPPPYPRYSVDTWWCVLPPKIIEELSGKIQRDSVLWIPCSSERLPNLFQ